jgi:hypothetical protein
MIIDLPLAGPTSPEARAERHTQRRRERRSWSPAQRARWLARREAQLRRIAAHYRRLRAATAPVES